MKNQELIGHINALDKIIKFESEKSDSEKMFSGRVKLLMMRNFRAMLKEYHENYEKDMGDLHVRFFVTEETDVTVPADEASGIEEHTEKRKVEVLRPDCTQEQYDEELKTLLDLDVSVKISKIKLDDVEKVTDFSIVDALDFMVE